LEAQEHGRELARTGDLLHLAGCMIYWGEGSKTRNTAQLTNSDPDMLGCFVVFLTRCYSVPPERICLSVNCHLGNGLALDEIESYWLETLALPRTCLRAATVSKPSSASQLKRNTLLYGTARIAVHSTFVVQSIYGAIQEYAGIDRPEWLDCTPPHLGRPLAA
jgi:hypothetical protein